MFPQKPAVCRSASCYKVSFPLNIIVNNNVIFFSLFNDEILPIETTAINISYII